jgi:NADH:ubiquinone oxidoreductase subunit F (NADH-binding)/(2Fe-2S) ferredoxin/ferredoxin
MTPQELKDLQEKARQRRQEYDREILLCTGTSCAARGASDLVDRLQGELIKRDLSEDYLVVPAGCLGLCAEGPLVLIQPDGILYTRVCEDDLPEIITQHLQDGKPVERLMYRSGDKICPRIEDIPFFGGQSLLVLRNRTMTDPERIDDYLGAGGYGALSAALTEMSPGEVTDVIERSGLRGRGGEGVPTATRWRRCREAAGRRGCKPLMVCNADDSDPGGFKDRNLVESDPHSVLEGMIMAAYAVGAREGYIYTRKEYPRALKRLERAVEQARDRGLLGGDILGSGFDFDVRVHRGAGAMVCGESSALAAALRGMPAEPVDLYVPLEEGGPRGRPVLVNNVETLANVPPIVEKGADWFASIGAGEPSGEDEGVSTGTKVLALSGHVRNTGLLEVPMGTTLREVVFDMGGGPPEGSEVKAVQVGGPSGALIPESGLDVYMEYDALESVGAAMGSGGVVVMDWSTCMVRYARYCVGLLLEESCGKCTPCREGLAAMVEILDRIGRGEGSPADLELLEEYGGTMTECSICGLGRSAASPVLSTLRHFSEEYHAHVEEGRCPAGRCTRLITYSIDPEKCTGCTACAERCPADAISGEPGETHVIDEGKCIRCGMCMDVCSFDAVEVR